MKYCSHCGKELVDEAVVCPHCGCAAETLSPPPESGSRNETLQLVAKIFMLIGCIACGAFLISLAWTVPMTVYYWRSVKENRPVGLAFKVCSLLFVSLIAGILMLLTDEVK